MSNFKPAEFICKCGQCDHIPPKYAANVVRLKLELDTIRNHVGKPLIITSGIRCEEHNKKEGGAHYSRHLTGEAADIKIEGMTGTEIRVMLLELIKDFKIKDGGIGTYKNIPNICHYDIGGSRRW